MRLEHRRRPKDAGGLATSNPSLYYLAVQLQHLCKGLVHIYCSARSLLDSSICILLHTTNVADIPTGLEAAAFAKSNRLLPTYTLI